MKTKSLALFLCALILLEFSNNANLSSRIKIKNDGGDTESSSDSEAMLLIKKDFNSEIKIDAGWINPLFKSMGINDLSLQEGVRITQHYNPTFVLTNKKEKNFQIPKRVDLDTHKKDVLEVKAKITETKSNKVNEFLNNEVADYVEFD